MASTDLFVLFAVAATFFSVVGVFGAVAYSGFTARRRLRQRIDSVKRRAGGIAAKKATELRLYKSDKDATVLQRLLGMLPNVDKLRHRLEKTGKDISLGRYVLACMGMALLGFVTFKFGLRQSLPVALLFAIVLGVGIPHLVIGRLGTKRVSKFLGGFAEAIDLIVRGLKSGLPVSESIAAVGREMPDPVGTEFRRVTDAVRFGQSMEDALWVSAKRIETPDFKFFVICLAVQKETGGNLGETLSNLADILRRRRQMKLKIKAMSSEARASAYIIGSLPFIIVAMLMALSPDYVMTLFTDPRGNIMAAIGLGMQLIGVVVMSKLVRFEI